MPIPDCAGNLQNTSVMKFMLTNINGLPSKFNLLRENATKHSWDIICVTETHLLPHLLSSIVELPEYSLIRHDTSGHVYKHGVCCYIHNKHTFDTVSHPLANVLSLRITLLNIYVLIVYRAPSNSMESNQVLNEYILNFCSGKEVILLGDFNLPAVDWSSLSLHCPPLEQMFLNTFLSLGLHQWVTEATYPRSGNILDLVLTTEPDRIGHISVMAPLPGCDHCPVSFDYIFDSAALSDTMSQTQLPKQRDWHKGKFRLANQLLSEVNWDFELAYCDVDASYNKFSMILKQVTTECVPLKSPITCTPPWSTRPPTSLINRRHLAWSKYKSARKQLGRHSGLARSSYATFANLNQQCKTYAVKAQAQYEESLILRSQDHPKLLHSYLRKKKTGRPTVGPLTLQSGQLSDDPKSMADLFADCFSSVYSKSVPRHPLPHQQSDGLLENITLTQDQILQGLLHLDGSSSMGPDEIHPLLLKNCATHLAYPLTLILNRSLQNGSLPSAWKTSLVVPIFKKGARYDPLNYRPISLTSVPSKLMERIVCKELMSYLESQELLNPHQFGFRSGRSTVDQLLLVYDMVSRQTDLGTVNEVILFDFSKAFDVVVHDLIIDKLFSLGIRSRLLKWITSFLKDRVMRVCIKGQSSQPKPVLSGVPQGSVLGPILFLIYINSIASQLKSNYKLFADDLKIYSCTDSNGRSDVNVLACQDVQEDINILHATALSWGLNFNADKCVALRFARPSVGLDQPSYFLDGKRIPVEVKAKDLGVLVDVKLKFHDHIQATVHKAGGLAESLLKSTVCRSANFMLFLFLSHIRPILEYASCLWNTGYVQDLRALERVQRRWTKHIDGMAGLDYGARLKKLELYSVYGRLLRADLILYWKIFHAQSCIHPNDLFHTPPCSRTRGHRYKIHIPSTVTDTRKRFFSVRCIPLWNSLLPDAVCAPNLRAFKRAINTYLQNELYKFIE